MSLIESLTLVLTGGWEILKVVAELWWIWIPILLTLVFINLWEEYVIERYIINNWEWVTLEVALQPEVEKSQRAMEQVITAMHGAFSSIDLWQHWWDGEIPEHFGLEIVSRGGDVHFIIHTLRDNLDLVKSAVYSQFPDVEIFEIEDYSKEYTHEDLERTYDLWGTDFTLAKQESYPIRTYPEFSEKEAPGVEVDPLGQITEGMASLGPGEELWLQIPIRPSDDSWTKKGQEEIDSILGSTDTDEQGNTSAVQRLTPGQTEQIKGIERKIAKVGFQCKLRLVYLAEIDKMNKSHISPIAGGIDQFGDNTLNGFKPDSATKTSVDLWRKQNVIRRFRKHIMLNNYQKRKLNNNTFHLNAEELATIFHFPGEHVTTTALHRVQSKKTSPPSSLPGMEE